MFGMFRPGAVFEAVYRAMPVAFIDKTSAEFGDKVILPPSALEKLAQMHVEYPMLFNVESTTTGRATHCGVLEFVAEEGVVYMPHWMMQNLLLQVGDLVKFRNVSLPKGKFVKLQPVTSDFLDISNPKAVLERTLRSYTCLTVGDCFIVNYNDRNYEIEVREAKPASAISIVETDCQVDFEAPKDYKEPEKVFRNKPNGADGAAAGASGDGAGNNGASGSGGAGAGASGSGAPEPEPGPETFLAFAGTARRLDGKPAVLPAAPVAVSLGGSTSMGTTPGAMAAAERAERAAALAAEAAKKATGKANADTTAGGKTGSFVSTGNRLQDKLLKEKAGKAGGAPPPLPKAEEKKEEPKFSAFGGKANSLK
ncbi:hypothetical protein FOA52_009498 [Chlamydomonas sp. UWO 241]|nr:hypothetical protein FOA52_009498 [Chlamydomonas sp. UWO 241]